MKHLTVILAIGCISAVCIAEPVPEAAKLDTEKYTIRFVRATGEGRVFESIHNETHPFEDIFPQKTIYTNEWSTFRFEDELLPIPKKNVLLSIIEQANPTYTELVSMPIEMGKEFSSDNGLLTGKVWCEMDSTDSDSNQNIVTSFDLKCGERPIKLDKHHLKVGEWICLGLGVSNKTEWVLIKLYEPQK